MEQKFPVPSCLRLIRIHAILFPFFSFLSMMDLQFVNFIIFANISLIEFSFKSLPRMTVYLQNLLDPYTICRLPFQDYFISKTLSLVRQAREQTAHYLKQICPPGYYKHEATHFSTLRSSTIVKQSYKEKFKQTSFMKSESIFWSFEIIKQENLINLY